MCLRLENKKISHWNKRRTLFGNHIRIGNRTRLYAVSVLDCTPFSFVGTTMSWSHYFSVLLYFGAIPTALHRHDLYSLS